MEEFRVPSIGEEREGAHAVVKLPCSGMWEASGCQARGTGQDAGGVNKGHAPSEAQLQGSLPPLVTAARR